MVEVKTAFQILDESSGPMKRIQASSDALQRSAEQAKRAVGQIGSAGGGGVVPARSAPTSTGERESFAVEREEMLIRRKRMRHMRLETQGERIAHQGAMTAMLLFGNEQNKAIAGVAKFSMAAQMTGMGMYQMGGKMGALGSVLTKIGGIGGLVAAGLEIGASVLEAFGVDIEKVGDKAKEWGAHLIGMKTADEMAQAAGYRTAAEQKLAEGLLKHMDGEAKADYAVREFAKSIPLHTPFENTPEAMAKFDKEIVSAALQVSAYSKGQVDLTKATEMVKEVAKQNWQTVSQQNAKNEAAATASAAIVDAYDLYKPGIYEAFEKTKELSDTFNKVSQELSQTLEIPLADAQEHLKKAMENRADNIERQFVEEERTKLTMADASKAAARALKMSIPGEHASNQAKQQYRLALLGAARAYMPTDILAKKPEMLKEFIEQIGETKTSMTMDFRGSHFSISQQFAEGYDIDRVLAGFVGGLQGLGERKMQSGLSPIYTPR